MSADSEDSTVHSVTQVSSLFDESASPTPSSILSVESMLTRSQLKSQKEPGGQGYVYRTATSPDVDASKYKLECRHLRSRVKQLLTENQTEQEATSQLRKKLSSVERERLETASKTNEELANLNSHVARLRSQLEKGEAVRQDLEFELAKLRRQIGQEKRSATEKETMMSDVSENMKAKINLLNQQIQELHGQLQEYKQTSEDEEKRLRRSLQEKEEIIGSQQTDIEALEHEKETQHADIQEKELFIADLNDQITKLEVEKEKMSDNIRRQGNDITYGKEKEDRLKQDLETAVQRIKTLEDNIEAERAAHLESKFNSEIVQLRVKDLETVVESEKNATQEEKSVAENLTQQLRELETAYAEERKMSKHTRDTLEKTEKEYSNVQRQLSAEVESKKTMIRNLSQQLELHQKNFDELKDELRKAKKRQAYLEETYGGSMRELELLAQSYQLDTSQPKLRKPKDRKDRNKPPSPSAVIESLRQTLQAYRKTLDGTTEELKKEKHTSTNLSKEGDSYKDILWAKEKALEDTQHSLEQTSKELERTRNECTELEAVVASLKVDVQSRAHEFEKEKVRNEETSDEIVKLAKKYKHDEEDKLHFMHQLYQRVLSMYRVPHLTGQVDYNKYSWGELSHLVQDQIGSLVTSLQNANEKVQTLEAMVRKLEQTSEDVQHEHSEQMERMTAMAREQEEDWLRQKQELEEHYTDVLSEVHGRSQKSQSMMDQAWEKVRVSGSIQHGLEAECAELRSVLQKTKQEQSALQTTCALVIGAFFPLYTRLTELASQRSVLLTLLESAELAKRNAQVLVETLSSEMDTELVAHKQRFRPLLRFRIAAVCVMAANRLQYFGRNNSSMFVASDGVLRDNSVLVSTGLLPQIRRPFRGVASVRGQGHTVDVHAALSWLTGGELVEIVQSCTVDLQAVLLRLREGGDDTDVKLFTVTAKSAFQKLLEKLERYFQSSGPGLIGACVRDRTSLVHNLGYSLNKSLGKVSVKDRGTLLSFKQTMSSLQHHLLEFTQKLHAAEVDRRDLRVELSQSKEEIERLLRTASHLEHTEGELQVMKNERKKLVESQRFDSVCQELQAALKREQQAQQLLNEQSEQLHTLSKRLDTQVNEATDKDRTLQDAVQGLSKSKLEVRRKEQVVKQLDEHIQELELQKKEMENSVYDAERALRTVARDKDALTNYIQTVQGAFERAKSELALSRGYTKSRDYSLSKILLSTELLPSDSGQLGPEMTAFQSLVGCFVDAQQQAFTKIEALEEEIESHRRHVNTLKNELNAACRREYDDEVTPFTSRVRSGVGEDRSRRNEFAPLIEDKDASVSHLGPPSDTPRSGTYRKSASDQELGRSTQYHTPNLSRRHPNIRPKASDNLYR